LIRHIKAAVKIAIALLEHPYYGFTQYEKDLIVGGLLIHDCVKSGFDYDESTGKVHTIDEHPMLVEQLINVDGLVDVDKLVVQTLVQAVRGHMGPWHKNKMPEPKTRLERFVHHCDYICSRKIFLDFDFS